MSVNANVAPNFASLILAPRPMPLPAPVIRMILLSKDGAIFALDRVELDVKRWVLGWNVKTDGKSAQWSLSDRKYYLI
jgi:hypothetical protein